MAMVEIAKLWVQERSETEVMLLLAGDLTVELYEPAVGTTTLALQHGD